MNQKNSKENLSRMHIENFSEIGRSKKEKYKEVYTGGKLYIAGEYSVLIPNQSAIIKNIDIFMKGEIRFSKEYNIYSDMYDYSVGLKEEDERYSLIQKTIETVNEYLELKGIRTSPFKLKITGKMERDGKKYGIGSSGSVTVLVVKSMAELYNFNISDETVFKLSAYVLMKMGDNGSMGDIACIAYNNLILYTSFDRRNLKKKIEEESLLHVIDDNWGFVIEKLKCPHKYEFLVGWTGKPSISREMIKRVKDSINKGFLETSEKIVGNLQKGIIAGEYPIIEECINNNGRILKELHSSIYSNELEILIKIAEKWKIPCKISGSGGGDCGIAICPSREDAENLTMEWGKYGIEVLYKSYL